MTDPTVGGTRPLEDFTLSGSSAKVCSPPPETRPAVVDNSTAGSNFTVFGNSATGGNHRTEDASAKSGSSVPPLPHSKANRKSFIELHACSAFSFLEGASTPEALAQEAARLGYPALALLDRNGVYGAPRFYRACREVGVRPIVGAEVSLPEGRLALLVESQAGYKNLCRLITNLQLRSEKGTGAPASKRSPVSPKGWSA